nr:MAG: hypothetical protein 3 [Leviviridae sp.]
MDFNPEYFYYLLQTELNCPDVSFDSDTSIRSAAKRSLIAGVLKKYLPDDSSVQDSLALSLFEKNNENCASFSIEPDRLFIQDVFTVARQLMHNEINSGPFQTNVLTLSAFLNAGRAGPGASCATKATNFFNKMFDGPLSTSSTGLYQFYLNGISDRWRDAESFRASAFPTVIVQGSKTSAVPKTSSISRTICTEPSLNMFFQLGAGECIQRLLRRYHNIDLSKQPGRNRILAQIGSVGGGYSTIDLSSASDTISTALVKYLLPHNAFAALDLVRSRATYIGDKLLTMNMFSSMGNGFTFPLQTYIFASLVKATYIVLGESTKSTVGIPSYSVFGDDIIVRDNLYHFVVDVLEHAGFEVNRQKSFSSGHFRESCGHDYFKGHNIRAVYIKSCRNPLEVYSTFNRLFRWSVFHHIPIVKSLQYIMSLAVFRPVPFDAADSDGFKVTSDHLLSPKRDRNGCIYYRSLRPRLVKRKIPDFDLSVNYDGAVISSIGGYIRNSSYDLRIFDRKCKVVKCKTPSWDFMPYAGLAIQEVSINLALILNK